MDGRSAIRRGNFRGSRRWEQRGRYPRKYAWIDRRSVLILQNRIYAAESDSVDPSQITKIEYSDLRELIKAGNFSYLQSQDSQTARVRPDEKMHETLKEEYNYLKKMADSYKNDGDTEMQALYENNAKNIRTSMAQVQSTINRMNSASQEKTMEDLADTLTASAQNLMNSYNQMAANVVAMEKNVEAAQSSYDAAVKKTVGWSHQGYGAGVGEEQPGTAAELPGIPERAAE